jgi:hypothetical protein
MFELEGWPGAAADDRHAAALTRLKAILPARPARLTQFGERRHEGARRLDTRIFRAPSARRSSFSPGMGHDASAAAEPDAGRPPGATMASRLNATDASALSTYDLLEAMSDWERVIAWAQANQSEVIAEFARRRPGLNPPDDRGHVISEFAADEIASRLRITRRAADLKLAIALDLADRLPATRQALLEGRIDLSKARAIAEHTANLTEAERRRTVEERVLRRAGSQTTSELRRSLLQAVAAVDSEAVVKRHARAKAERFLSKHLLPDGMAELTAVLPADDAMVVYTAADALARAADPDDPRPIDARRVDALVDLCRPVLSQCVQAAGSSTPSTGPQIAGQPGDHAFVPAGTPSCTHMQGQAVDHAPTRPERRSRRRRLRRHRRGGPHIQVTVAATTLLGLDDLPGELAGYGPIPAEMARQIAGDPDSTWRRILTDPVSGVLLDYGTTVYRPPPALARHVIARDQVCCFPGCRQPAEYCDLDHRNPYPDGTTSEGNLGSLCRHHHRAKTEGGWSWRRARDGTITWSAPTGHEYEEPTPAVIESCPASVDHRTTDVPPF